ncbi:MAG: protein ndvB [Paracoccus denitrificans]|nr:MAG: protein ndvB [Paracoccus denitrificans]PZO84445.1 MAG: protein ndvB [Paracoccus denitrificans]
MLDFGSRKGVTGLGQVDSGDIEPIRFQFWTGGSLFAAGQDLAADARPDVQDMPTKPVRRLNENQKELQDQYLATVAAAASGELVTPAAEWLIDNNHMVEENIRQLREGFNRGFLSQLPLVQLADGRDMPRALVIAWYVVALTNSEITAEALTEFLQGYQTRITLNIAELWAIPVFLRFALIENLNRLAKRVTLARARRNHANAIADAIADAPSRSDINALITREGDWLKLDTVAAQLMYRLRDSNDGARLALDAIERSGGGPGSLERAVQAEYARQSSGNVTTGNIVRSLRRMGEIDWLTWFEDNSRVDALLNDTTEFGRLDQPTRSAYRAAIERIARRSELDEVAVTKRALEAAGADAVTENAQDHGLPVIGHLLVGEARNRFAEQAGYDPTLGERLGASYRRLGWLGIVLPMSLLTIVLLAILNYFLPVSLGGWQRVLLLALAAWPASDTALRLVSFIVSRTVTPKRLPAYDFRTDGPPTEARTLVVIPGMISSLDAVDELADTLELHYLANPRGDVSFALLTDWRDAPTEHLSDDQMLLDAARERIEVLADRYDHGGKRRFFLLHRRRQWNSHEGAWMGWERKRGKLAELNELLRGGAATSFIDTGATPPEGVRYVVTLDSDTRLPRDTVPSLVGKMAHPVNRAVARPDGTVKSGYGIMQPRVTPSLTTGADASIFQRIFSVNRGMDPYVFTVSDLYQDLYGEGSFTGKGIYDVDAFERAMDNRIPENRVLSHDLLEGSLARAALVTDIEVVEDFPLRYSTESARQHRWTRGDWQLLPFIFDRANGLSGLARWKMVDNLRREIVSPAWLLASVAGWLTLPGWWAAGWQVAMILLLALVAILQFDVGILMRRREAAMGYYARGIAKDALGYLMELGLRVASMADRAANSIDAITRAMWRMFVSKRHLLEWTTARESASAHSGIPAARRLLSPAIGIVALLATALINPSAIPVALVMSVLWIVAPWVGQRVSQPLATEDRLLLSNDERSELRGVARVTWRFFEDFVNEQTNHLPPDNFQDLPAPKLAERTSPTNIGLYLMSVMSARDFGWLGMDTALGRITDTLNTMQRMPRYRGHFYNWYDTRNLTVLPQPYLSSVDSGNLAGLLVALSAGLRMWAQAPAAALQTDPAGLGDTLGQLRLAYARLPAAGRRSVSKLRETFGERLEGFASKHASVMADPKTAPIGLQDMQVLAADIQRLAQDVADTSDDAEAGAGADVLWWAKALTRNCAEVLVTPPSGRDALAALTERLTDMSERARAMAFEMDFGLFVQREKMLLSIGYRPLEEELDESCYDLLASEARLTSFLSIAKGDLPKEHWSRLGRPFAAFGSRGALLSWSGCMFEYLMPPLLMKERHGGILSHSNSMAVDVQMEYGRSRSMPWGVSESAFNARDRDMNYQYYAFGVPALALKRGGGDPVVAPYATILAAQIRPEAAVRNLARLTELGARGPWGFYDAVDFTPTRQSGDHTHEVVRNVMAHHHGMSIMAIANTVLDGIHRDRFHDDPVVRAAELLLQEKSPREVVPVTRAPLMAENGSGATTAVSEAQTYVDDPAHAPREVALLSNGNLSTMISSTGAGQSSVGSIAINRWQADPTKDRGGIFLMMRDVQSGEWWSATPAPFKGKDERASAIFSDHKAEFFKTANAIESKLEVVAATEANADGRRLTLRNRSGRDRVIEVTSYGEIVLDNPGADRAHPAFSKMFVWTDIRNNGNLIVAERRPRDPSGTRRYLAHLVTSHTAAIDSPVEAETDRRAFIGRGRSLGDPAALLPGATLSGAKGYTLDPVFAIRRRIRVPAGRTVSLIYWTIMADTEEARDEAAAHYAHSQVFDHELRLAWTWSQVQLRHLGITVEDAQLYRRFAAFLVYPDLRLALGAEQRAGLGPQSSLWPMGISGDDPITVIRIDDEADLPIVVQALKMHQFLRARGVPGDLVVLNERASSYVQDLQHAIRARCDMAIAQAGGPDPARHVHAIRRDQLSAESFNTLMAAARVVLHTRNGKLSDQLNRLPESRAILADRDPLPDLDHRAPDRPRQPPPTPLLFWNGYGGFSDDGREYVLRVTPDRPTPQPWINVIARDDFGFHVSAEGAAFTWAENSRDYQVTPWSNDPVTNPVGETILIHDPETGRVATPFPALCTDRNITFEVAHGMGYSRFAADFGWVYVEAIMTLAHDQPARLTRLKVTNRTGRTLRVQGIAYAELVLGNDRAKNATMLQAKFDPQAGAILVTNPYSTEFAGRVTALACDRKLDGICASRTAYLGRGGRVKRPTALTQWPTVTAPEQSLPTDADPCAAIRWTMSIEPDETIETTVVLADTHADKIADVLQAVRGPDATEKGLAALQGGWDDFLSTIQVETPDPKLNILVNSWLPYQALGCRINARTAFYQASGAYGFRDQLQDTAALILQNPDLCRRQILNAASRQFPEGDFQHWWLPRTGAGVRTMISDDVVWLGNITAHYINSTGDKAILDENLEFIQGPELEPGQHDKFFQPDKSGDFVTLYEHCARGIELAKDRTGPHGLPLILGGDWNDGMNRVGEKGRGESVWLGWFLCATIDAFLPIARARGDDERAEGWEQHRKSVARALDQSGWDGAWYRRGYFDDGSPLGSSESSECRIDSIAQSWALISGAGRSDRASRGVDAALAQLFDQDAGIMRLFTPPFSTTTQEPGYIKSYPPGVRENGGQYTHAASWMIYALARSGDGTRAHRLFDAINPITHASDRASSDRYRVEPYVVAADIYGAQDKSGRGGWTWYTGSAGWFFRAAVEGILGIQRQPGGILVTPNLPDDWPGFVARIKQNGITRRIEVTRTDDGVAVMVDDQQVAPGRVIPFEPEN